MARLRVYPRRRADDLPYNYLPILMSDPRAEIVTVTVVVDEPPEETDDDSRNSKRWYRRHKSSGDV